MAIKKKKMKYFFLTLEIRDGEREYSSEILRASSTMTADKIGEYEASTFWDTHNGKPAKKYDIDSDWYEHCGGETMVRCRKCIEIPKVDYDVLAEYL